MTTLLALAASTHPTSLNKRLLALAVAQAKSAGATILSLDYAECEAPLYHGNHEAKLPAGAAKLSEAIQASDGILLASPEYNWSIPGALKNLIDWLSVDRAAPLQGRTALLFSATPSVRGGISGLQHLRVPLEVLGMWVYPQVIGIGEAPSQLTETGLARPKDQQRLVTCVHDFVRATAALQGKTHA